MRLYKRSDFIKLPAKTIYSRIEGNNIFDGLFCKTSGDDWMPDWIEQDLISETGFPKGIEDGGEAIEYFENLRDSFQDFRTNFDSAGRDGCFNDADCFVVWDNEDIKKLSDYLISCLK